MMTPEEITCRADRENMHQAADALNYIAGIYDRADAELTRLLSNKVFYDLITTTGTTAWMEPAVPKRWRMIADALKEKAARP